MPTRISKILALIVLTINLYISGLFTGVDEASLFLNSTSIFGVGFGPSIYSTLSYYHLLAAICLFGFVIGKTIKKEILSQVISFSSIFLTIYFFRKIYLLKKIYISDLRTFSDLTPIHNSIKFDWFLYFIVLILLIYQIFTVYKYFSGKNHKMN